MALSLQSLGCVYVETSVDFPMAVRHWGEKTECENFVDKSSNKWIVLYLHVEQTEQKFNYGVNLDNQGRVPRRIPECEDLAARYGVFLHQQSKI